MISFLLLTGCGVLEDLQSAAEEIIGGEDVTVDVGTLDPSAGLAALQTVARILSVEEVQSMLGSEAQGEDVGGMESCVEVEASGERSLLLHFAGCSNISGDATVQHSETGVVVMLSEGFSLGSYTISGGIGLHREGAQSYAIWSAGSTGGNQALVVSAEDGTQVSLGLNLLGSVEDQLISLSGVGNLELDGRSEVLYVGGRDEESVGRMPLLLDPVSGCACPVGGMMAWATSTAIPIDPNDVGEFSVDVPAVEVNISGTLLLDYVEDACGVVDASFDANGGATLEVAGTEIVISEETVESQVNQYIDDLIGEGLCE